MTHSPPVPPARDHEALLALRLAIAHLARQCSLDLGDRQAVRLCLDGRLAAESGAEAAPFQDLRTMIVLLHRLENCISEDLGYSGLQRLWRQHDEILASFPVPDPQSADPGAARP